MDWQLTRFTSPVIDLHHIIFTSTDKALRDKEYQNILDHYYSTLTRAIKRLGSPADLFSRRDFDEHLRRFGVWPMTVSMFMLLITLADSEDVPDLDELCERLDSQEKSELVTKFSAETQIVYTKRVRDLVNDMYNLKLYTMKKALE